jgi:hypothetical protein
LKTFIQGYDDVAFGMKFSGKKALTINVKGLSSLLHSIPQSSGEPIFLFGLNEEMNGFWFDPIIICESESASIFPLEDDDTVCLFYAVKKPKPSFMRYH